MLLVKPMKQRAKIVRLVNGLMKLVFTPHKIVNFAPWVGLAAAQDLRLVLTVHFVLLVVMVKMQD